MLGFRVKAVERNGSTLRNQFPQSSLWEGEHCGRSTCITCNQGAEFSTNCTKKSAVYENICAECNKGAGGKEEVREVDTQVPSLYIGETSRTLQERGREHWADYRGGAKAKQKSHIFKHQELQHRGEEAKFMLRAISFHKSALSRQTAEAVRIKRRGGEGAVLNSKAEFNRCYIPRLRLVDEEETKEMEKLEEESLKELEMELLTQDNNWERSKAATRKGRPTPSLAGKHKLWKEDRNQRAPKKLKHDILVNWGRRLRQRRLFME